MGIDAVFRAGFAIFQQSEGADQFEGRTRISIFVDSIIERFGVAAVALLLQVGDGLDLAGAGFDEQYASVVCIVLNQGFEECVLRYILQVYIEGGDDVKSVNRFLFAFVFYWSPDASVHTAFKAGAVAAAQEAVESTFKSVANKTFIAFTT